MPSSVHPTDLINQVFEGLELNQPTKDMLVGAFWLKYLQELLAVSVTTGAINKDVLLKIQSLLNSSINALEGDKLRLAQNMQEALKVSVLIQVISTFTNNLDSSEQSIVNEKIKKIMSES